MKNPTIKPPPNVSELSIVHKIGELYKKLYQLGNKIPKRDKFGIHLKIEKLCLDSLSLSIQAGLSSRETKTVYLEKLRITAENTKHLVRMANELKIFDDKIYLCLQSDLQEVSKMATAWKKYAQKEP